MGSSEKVQKGVIMVRILQPEVRLDSAGYSVISNFSTEYGTVD